MDQNEFDAQSLTNQEALGGALIESSSTVGWRAVLLERRRWQPGSHEVEGSSTSDIRLSIAHGTPHLMEILNAGRWTIFDVGAGAVGTTQAGEVDRLRWRAKAPTQTTSLYIPKAVMASAQENLGRAKVSLRSDSWPDMFRDPAVLATIAALIDGMRSGAPEIYAEQTVAWLIMHLLLKRSGAKPETLAAETQAFTDRRLQRVIELIRARLSDPISLDQLAQEACISKFHFARLFRSRTGLSPHGFILEERMKAARDLLVNTDLTIAEIGRRTGYRQGTHFGAAFRKAHGLTPSDFRRRAWSARRGARSAHLT